MLQITPNGPWGKDVHPHMPVTLDELISDLSACFEAGADGVHLHVRDQGAAETLDPAVVNETCRRVREAAEDAGQVVEIGLTTGEWIVPDLHERIAMIREWEGVDCATVNLSEVGFERVMSALVDAGIGVDVGLGAAQEVAVLIRSGFLPQAQRISIELNPGEPYFLKADPRTVAQQVNEALDEAGSAPPRLTHGMKAWTWPLVEDAFSRGHHTRVGFEDSVFLPNGKRAQNNAELVAAAVALRVQIEGR
jgi:uncharacterized protein (DUF849 family)